MSIKVGDEILGRTVNALGEPIDGKGPIKTTTSIRIERKAPIMNSNERIPFLINLFTHTYINKKNTILKRNYSTLIHREHISPNILLKKKKIKDIQKRGMKATSTMGPTFFNSGIKKSNYQKIAVKTWTEIYTPENIIAVKNVPKKEQYSIVNNILVKQVIESSDALVNADITVTTIPRFKTPLRDLKNSFEYLGVSLSDIRFEGHLNNYVNYNTFREIHLLKKFNAPAIVEKTLLNGYSRHPKGYHTRQKTSDYEIKFKNGHQIFTRVADGKHGEIKIENATTITQTYFNSQSGNFESILNTDLNANTYINNLEKELLTWQEKLKNSPQEKEYISEIIKILKNKNIPPFYRIEIYKEMAFPLLGMLENKGLRGFNPCFLVIDHIKNLESPNEKCIISKHPNGFDNNFTRLHMYKDIITNHCPKVIPLMKEAKGSLLETPLAFIENITNL